MEKIAIAVQRARDAEQKSDVPLGPTQATPPEPVPSGGMPRRIVYTRTPTVPIAPRVLERHRVTSVNNDITADPFRMLRTQVLMQMPFE